MTAGYWRDPELTARNIREEWFRTGDLAYKDDEDFYWFVSRKSEIIKHQAGPRLTHPSKACCINIHQFGRQASSESPIDLATNWRRHAEAVIGVVKTVMNAENLVRKAIS